MKKSLIASIFFVVFALSFAQAQKQPMSPKNTKKHGTTAPASIEQAAVVHGISIIVVEMSGTPCETALTAVPLANFAAAPNTPVDKTSKGLDGSIQQCCSLSTTGSFMLRISYVDCNGQPSATRRNYEVATSCKKDSKELMPLILDKIGKPGAGGSYLVQKIKVWQQ